jgi:hypothetical protein
LNVCEGLSFTLASELGYAFNSAGELHRENEKKKRVGFIPFGVSSIVVKWKKIYRLFNASFFFFSRQPVGEQNRVSTAFILLLLLAAWLFSSFSFFFICVCMVLLGFILQHPCFLCTENEKR